MCAKLFFNNYFIIAVWLLNSNSTLLSQDFLEGLNLYNRAQYDSVIHYCFPDFIQQNPQEEGLARYILAESYYNKALRETDAAKAKSFFENARNEFNTALKCPDLKINYTEYYYSCKYKMGWCSYRLAELNIDLIDNLQRAYQEFILTLPGAPDSTKLLSYFMAGESKIRENLFKIYKISDSAVNSVEINEITNSYADVRDSYNKIINYLPTKSAPANLKELQAVVRIKKELLNYYAGKLYQVLSPELFILAKDPNKKSDSDQTAQDYFTGLKYDTLFIKNPPLSEKYNSTISYFNLIKNLNQYILTGNESAKKEFIARRNEIKEHQFTAERNFRRGNLYHRDPEFESGNFNELTINYYDSSRSIVESYYWMGYMEMIQNNHESSRVYFVRYIKNVKKNISFRQRILLDDAQFRIYLLDFDSFYLSNNFHRLKKLGEDIKKFTPKSQLIQKRKDLLYLLVNSCLTNNTSLLWSEILIGSDSNKLEQVFNSIMFILPRAALNIGTTREKYVILMNRLFELTDILRSDETHFFKGIVKTLEAEIQAHPTDKIMKFKEAAEIFDSISSEYVYKNEADYIKGRCLFFADKFDQAETIFQRLINQQKNLRALFYLAEIFRLSEYGMAAKRCYSVIIDKFHNLDDQQNEYWLINAKAGLSSSDDSGGLEILNNINIESVEFLPRLLSKPLTYEKLADENHLQQQYAREAVEWLMKFCLPQKEIYPSKNRLNNSIFVSENIFENFPFVIDETRKAITSSLNLTVHLPENVDSESEVYLGNDILESQNGNYMSGVIPLNSVHELYVKNSDCYTFKETCTFSKAGENKKIILLNKKINYSVKHRTKNIVNDIKYHFSSRWDGNNVLKNSIGDLNPSSEFKTDFSALYELRDFALDKAGNRILAVNAIENSIWIYSNDLSGKREGSMHLNFKNPLNSPEGIAVDSIGNIYVSDWANHRLIQLTNSGEVVQTIGTFGLNSRKNAGQPIKLVFPTRLAIVEDQTGVEIDGQSFFREKYIYIADQNGIHICNMNGDYLGTPLPSTDFFPNGAFYGFVVEKYGIESRLFLVNRSGNSREKIIEFIAN